MRIATFNKNDRFTGKSIVGLGNWFGTNRAGAICPVNQDIEINRFAFRNKTIIILDDGKTNEALYLYKDHSDLKLRVMSYTQICLFNQAIKNGYRFYFC